MKLSEIKKFLRDLCKTLDHEFNKGKCTRCQKKFQFQIWEDIGCVVYNTIGVGKINVAPEVPPKDN